MRYILRDNVSRRKLEILGFEHTVFKGKDYFMKIIDQKKYQTRDEDLIVLCIEFPSCEPLKKYRLTTFWNQVYDTKRQRLKKLDIKGLESVFKNDDWHLCFQKTLWWRYILPRRLTVKVHRPIYKWLCFILSKGE